MPIAKLIEDLNECSGANVMSLSVNSIDALISAYIQKSWLLIVTFLEYCPDYYGFIAPYGGELKVADELYHIW